jgi:hypothetical protein
MNVPAQHMHGQLEEHQPEQQNAYKQHDNEVTISILSGNHLRSPFFKVYQRTLREGLREGEGNRFRTLNLFYWGDRKNDQ